METKSLIETPHVLAIEPATPYDRRLVIGDLHPIAACLESITGYNGRDI